MKKLAHNFMILILVMTILFQSQSITPFASAGFFDSKGYKFISSSFRKLYKKIGGSNTQSIKKEAKIILKKDIKPSFKVDNIYKPLKKEGTQINENDKNTINDD